MFASVLASLMVLAFVANNIRKHSVRKRSGQDKSERVSVSKAEGCVSAVLSGTVAANGLFHFLHGVLDYRDFPAPFAEVLGRGLTSDVSNIIWGLFNLILAAILVQRHRNTEALGRVQFALFFLLGLVGVSLLLRFVLLASYFATHPF